MHLARAGWIRWRENAPTPGVGRGKGPLARGSSLGCDRTGAAAGSGFDVTEAGTKKSLAIHVVRDPQEVPGIARLGPDPMDPDFTQDVLAGILKKAGRAQIKGVLRHQGTIAGIGNAYSDEILHVAKMSPFKPADMPPEDVATLYTAMRETLADALARADGVSASELKAEKKSGLRVHGRNGEPCPVCGDTVRQVIYSDIDVPVLPDLPDRRQAARRPGAVAAAEVASGPACQRRRHRPRRRARRPSSPVGLVVVEIARLDVRVLVAGVLGGDASSRPRRRAPAPRAAASRSAPRSRGSRRR